MTKEDFESKVRDHSQTFDTSVVFSTNALAGEVGELCNVSKKIVYLDNFPTYKKRVAKEVDDGKRLTHSDMLLDEAGDALFYLVQTLLRAGFTLEECMDKQASKLDDYCAQYDKHFVK